MAKKQEKPPRRIKTSRYWTKNCSSCGFDYPNWFTTCPKCGAPWVKPADEITEAVEELPAKKTIKIVVKITDESEDNPIISVFLIFTADGGHSWFKVQMEKKQDYYISEIDEMPIGSDVIYYIEAEDASGEKILENNEGEYFFYHVGPQTPEEQKALERQAQLIENPSETTNIPFLIEKSGQQTPAGQKSSPFLLEQSEDTETQESIKASEPAKSSSQPKPKSEKKMDLFQDIKDKLPKTPQPYESKPITPAANKEEELTIFGKPHTKREEDLKFCPSCKSKIKKLWTTCPICGHKGV